VSPEAMGPTWNCRLQRCAVYREQIYTAVLQVIGCGVIDAARQVLLLVFFLSCLDVYKIMFVRNILLHVLEEKLLGRFR